MDSKFNSRPNYSKEPVNHTVLIYCLATDRVKRRPFASKQVADRYAWMLKQQLLDIPVPATIHIEVVPS